MMKSFRPLSGCGLGKFTLRNFPMTTTFNKFPSPFGVWVRKGVVQEPFQNERFRSRIDALVILP